MKYRFGVSRSLFGSDFIIAYAIGLHLFEAGVFLYTPDANGTIGMTALLAVFHYPWLAAATMVLASLLAVIGEWVTGISPMNRLRLLLPQQSLLVFTALGAVLAVYHGAYADGVTRSWLFILCDQLPRIATPFFYTTAIVARVKFRGQPT